MNEGHHKVNTNGTCLLIMETPFCCCVFLLFMLGSQFEIIFVIWGILGFCGMFFILFPSEPS